MASHAGKGYYFPGPSTWPVTGAVGIGLVGLGAALAVNGMTMGFIFLAGGLGVVIYMMFGWFGTVVHESEGGQYDRQVDRSYRWSMSWFIFSEVMFFAAFFGALFYMRVLSVPWLGDLEQKLLWPDFSSAWPTAGPGAETRFTPMAAWGIPAINTLLLLSSGVTVTWAHWALKRGDRAVLKLGLFLTIALGVTFLAFQVYEYGHAYAELNLKLTSGAYGSTFFMLTGFHGMHVTLGVIMLTVMFFRVLAGHFTPDHHFAFEGVSWYWHFVDVVWLGLFIFVYWL